MPKFIVEWILARVSVNKLFRHQFLDPVTPLEWAVMRESIEVVRKRAPDISFHDLEETMRNRKNKTKKGKEKKKNIVAEREKLQKKSTSF